MFLDNTLAGMSEEMQKIQKLQSENEKLKKHLLPLLELTERYGSPGKWKAMITTALKIQYAIRSYQANGDKESIAQAMKILKDGEEYMKEHHISG